MSSSSAASYIPPALVDVSVVEADEAAPLPSSPANGHGHGHGHSHGHAGHAGAMNMRALLLHILGDALGNVGVIAAGLIIWLAKWKFRFYFDPIISLVITIIIFCSALPLGEFSSPLLSSRDLFKYFWGQK
jgi:solute carrier family 30 (zinc transporter), member 1